MTGALPVNVLAGRTAPGGNRPPLAELLAEELASARTRADELLASARAARITTAEEAAKVADLIVLLRDQERELDRARDVRKRPQMLECRTIEAAYGALIGPLARARTDALVPMLTAWRQEHVGETLAPTIASVGSRREIAFVIEDLPVALGWLLQHHGAALTQAVRTIIGAELRHAGVAGAADVKIPGVSVSIKNKAQVK